MIQRTVPAGLQGRVFSNLYGAIGLAGGLSYLFGGFLIDLHPDWPNALLLGGGSGHGFKHGPEVGRYAAARLMGSGTPEPRFSLTSKGITHHREVH